MTEDQGEQVITELVGLRAEVKAAAYDTVLAQKASFHLGLLFLIGLVVLIVMRFRRAG